MLYQALCCKTGPLCTPLGLVGLASSLLNPSRPPRDRVQLKLRTHLHEVETVEIVLLNCDAMELHEVETMEIVQVEEMEIVSAQVEDLNELHRQKIEELEFEAPE